MKCLYLFLLSFILVNSSAAQTKLVRTLGTDKYANVQCGLQDKAGNMWFATAGEGIYRYDGKHFTQFTTKDGLTSNKIWSILEDNTGNIWAGTDNGLCRLQGNLFKHVPFANFYSYIPLDIQPSLSEKNEVWSMMKDKSGKLWFGTREGLYCYDGKSFSLFLDNPKIINKENLRLNMVECLLEDKNGIIWIGSGMIPGDEGICRYDPHSHILTSYKPGGDGWIRYMVEDKRGNIWIGTRHEGIWVYKEKSFSRFMTGGDIGLSAVCDKAGNVWLSGGEKHDGYSSDGGIWLYDNKTLKKISTENLGGYSVWCIVQDTTGNLWFGTRNIGLYRYDGKVFTRYSE